MKKRKQREVLDLSKIIPSTPVEAVYTPGKLPSHAGNPLIEAIRPVPKDDVEAAERMAVPLPFDIERAKGKPNRERLDLIDYLDDLYIPTTWHCEKEQRLTSMLLKGLRARNPLTPDGARTLIAGQKLPFLMDDPAQKPEGSICLIDGMSGMGKTTFVKGVARLWGGPVILHTKYKGKYCQLLQISYLKVNCPEDASLKGLAKNLLFAVVQLIGPDKELADLLLNENVTRKDLVLALRYLISAHFIGVLIIDEIRNLFLKRSRRYTDVGSKDRDTEIVAFLMNLRDEVKIPIVLIGTPEAAEHLDTSLSINRRLVRDGDFTMLPPTSCDDPDWELLCDKVWTHSLLRKSSRMTSDIRKMLHDKTAGIPGLFVALFQSCQRWAIRTEEERINEDLIELAYQKDFGRLEKIITAIREGKQEAKLQWEDIWVPLKDRK